MSEITAHHGILKDVNLHVDDTGGVGRAVVLIHGWPLSGESWSEQIPALTAAGFRVISYDRRGFGRSDKPRSGYDYDTLTDDLQAILETLNVTDATLVGFSMGGGEVARYVSRFGEERLHSVVFASAVPPFMQQQADNPDGPLTEELANGMTEGLKADPASFYDGFTVQFFTANGELKVTEAQRQDALRLANQADKNAALQAMAAFGSTDFREDLPKVTVPTLVIHGDADGVVPFEGSGARTHATITGSDLHVVVGGPHGINVSHANEFNAVLLAFLDK
ncbi:hydrolase [Salinibacterium xinjiangense]|uniref:Pimeloyl-ACP methyl ester carboxylesterase n=1 Tax=Salinibacterium xinjiangense TaxID=386302 RepID=A0A2C8YLE3_9MICO|nr:alpha/beta hydrolase [Salinibacterium xinjiangense]GGK97702.1 hydrolase [Salinibacterium xinjiangense]SOE51260.1 Pimeloyl-ACP methyl ester carboxylesterase [Salinibacterium xinjiangense]